jgi:MFS family permease
MALLSIILAPIVGRFTDRVHPRILTATGFAITAVAIFLLSRTLTADGPVWPILASFALLGIGMAGIWAPLAATATRNLPMSMAGAGSGVYNATRQVGAVLGSAAIAVLLDSRIAAHGLSGGAEPDGALQQLPAIVRAPFSAAMSDTLLLPVGVLALGFVAVLFFELPRHLAARIENVDPVAHEEPAPAAAVSD